jgi:hypothetical protein
MQNKFFKKNGITKIVVGFSLSILGCCAMSAQAQNRMMKDMTPYLIAQQASSKAAKPQKLTRITLEEPWIVPNDPQYQYKPGGFGANFANDACVELLQGYAFKWLKWKSPACKLIEITVRPKHGVLVDEGAGNYGFKPTDSYLGRDRVQYIIEGVDGRRVLVTMHIALQTLGEAFALFDSSKRSLDGAQPA